jgi:AcrR family transcriptional regulator
MSWQRARTEENINERKIAIQEAAFTLFKNNGYDDVSFNAIASQAGFTKSNMYRYFSSKEEIFLNIFSDLFESWVNDCLKSLKKLKSNTSLKTFAKTYVDSHKNHTKFLDLVPILFLSLERNSSYEQLLKFKSLSKNLLYGLAVEIARIFPKLPLDKSFQYLNLSFAATSSFWAGSRNNEVLNKIYSQDELKDLKMNFDEDLSAAIVVILKGLLAN